MALLTSADVEWLRSACAHLKPNEDCTEARGTLAFSAAYDAATDQFYIVRSPYDAPPGLRLSGAYDVLIKDIVEFTEERWLLPRLYIQDETFPFCPERHFMLGKSACLCGPSEEALLLNAGFVFPRYLEELCIPFLYGQVYFDGHGVWPWATYDHDTVGVLQSYGVCGGPDTLAVTLGFHLHGKGTWPKIRAVLANKKLPKGHMPCFCERHAPIRVCHPEAWEGLKKLYADVHAGNIALPSLGDQAY